MEFLLVHSPFLGPGVWWELSAVLVEQGHKVLAPDLRPALRAGARAYEAMAWRSVADASAEHCVVMHSGAGGLAPSIWAADKRLVRYIFLDALLPHPGQSWMETLPSVFSNRLRRAAEGGSLPAWSTWLSKTALDQLLPDHAALDRIVGEATETPLSYVDAHAPSIEAWSAACRCAYLRVSDGYDTQADEAAVQGMAVARFPGDHFSFVTAPRDVAAALIALSAQIA